MRRNLSGSLFGSENAPLTAKSESITGAFYIPLIIMIVMYYKIYAAAKRVVDADQRAQINPQVGASLTYTLLSQAGQRFCTSELSGILDSIS